MSLLRPVRKLIEVFRGDIAPILIALSVAFGFWFGLMPGFSGLHVAILVLALVLNLNIGLFLLLFVLGKAICFAAAPVLFHTGAWVQQSASPLLTALAGIPIIGLTDFSRYAVAGAILLGPVVGLVLGLILARAVVSFRRNWLKLDEGSEKFRKWRSKGWVQLLDRLLLGKSAKDVGAVLKRRPRFIRIPGVILAVLLVAGFLVGVSIAEDKLSNQLVSRALTQVNGAEVNVDAFDLQALSGRASAAGVAMTDPEKPSHNRVQVGALTADVNLWNLLLGRVVVDELALADVKFDQPRQTAGEVLEDRFKPEPPKFDLSRFELEDLAKIDPARLESYYKEAEKIRDFFRKIQNYLPDRDAEAPKREKPVPESYLEYLTARAPVARTPRLIIRRIEVDNVPTEIQPFGESKVACTNLSDAPQAAGLPVTIELTSNEQNASMTIVSHYEEPELGAGIKAEFNDIDLGRLQKSLNDDNPVRFTGGTATGEFLGTAGRDFIDVGIKVATKNLQMSTPGGKLFDMPPEVTSQVMDVVDNLETTIRLVGPTAEPRLVFDVKGLEKSFAETLIAKGKGELAKQLNQALGDQVPGAEVDLDQLEKDPAKAIGDAATGFLQGGGEDKDDKEQKTEDEKDDDEGGDLLRGLRDAVK